MLTGFFFLVCCIYREDRQFRVEERDNDGTVRGQYGYVDTRGRAHVMNYTSSAEEGFRVVRDS